MGATMNDVQLQALLKALEQGGTGKRRKTVTRTNGQKPPSVMCLPNGEEVPMSPEAAAKLEELYQPSLKDLERLDVADHQLTYEDRRLQVLYPDRLVVWRDSWKGRGKKRTLVRTILYQTRSLVKVLDFLEKHDLNDDPEVHYMYVYDPDGKIVHL
jgi:hypothetical protein